MRLARPSPLGLAAMLALLTLFAAFAPPATARESSDVALRKRAETKSARVGDSVTYTITVTNRGPATAFDMLVGEDAPDQLGVTAFDYGGGTHVPQFAFPCRYDSLAKGDTATATFVATVTLDAALGTRVTNRAFVAESSAPTPMAATTRPRRPSGSSSSHRGAVQTSRVFIVSR